MYQDFLLAIFEYADKNNIRYCILRNYEQLPYDAGNDLDILVHADDRSVLMQGIISIGANFEWSLVGKPCGFSLQALIFVKSDEHLRIDMFSFLTKGWLRYADVNQVLATRVMYRDFWVASQDFVYFTVVIKEFLTYGYVRDKYKQLLVDSKVTESEFIDFGKCFFTENSLKALYHRLNTSPHDKASISLVPKFLNVVKPVQILKWLFMRIYCSFSQRVWRRS